MNDIQLTVRKDMSDFGENLVLLVLVSEHYDSSEYIKDLDEYFTETAQNK